MAFAAAGAAIAGLASNAISAGQSHRSQRRAYQYARRLQQQQYDLSIQGYKEAPNAQRTGLENAGYNPMLALGNVGQGVNVAGGTPVNANATDTSGIKESISQAVQLRNQSKQTEAVSDEAYANADKAKAEKATIIERLPYVSKQAKADYMKTSMESAKLENDIHYQDEYLNYLEKSLQVQQRLGEMGFANAKDVANINASASRYSANQSYNASTYAADVAAKSTPFRYFSDKYDKYVSKNGFKTPYEMGYRYAKRFLFH